MSLPQQLPLPQMQVQWAAQLNPLISNVLTQGRLIQSQSLINGVTVINHKLGRKMQGWIITDQTGAASIYRSQPFNDLTLTLTSDAAINIALWVF